MRKIIPTHIQSKHKLATLLMVTAIIFLAGAGVNSIEIGPNNILNPAEEVAAEARNINPRRTECHPPSGGSSPSCIYGGKNIRAIMIGDSHANALITSLAIANPKRDDGIMEWTYSICPTLIGANPTERFLTGRTDYKCKDFNEWILKNIPNIPKNIPLIVVNRFTVYAIGYNESSEMDPNSNTPLVYFSELQKVANKRFLDEYSKNLTDTLCRLAKDHILYVVRPIPEMGINVPRVLAKSISLGISRDISISLEDYHQRHAFIWKAQDNAQARCGVRILDPLPYLCWDGRCHGTLNGRPLYFDDDHLSESGNKLLVPMFAEVFK